MEEEQKQVGSEKVYEFTSDLNISAVNSPDAENGQSSGTEESKKSETGDKIGVPIYGNIADLNEAINAPAAPGKSIPLAPLPASQPNSTLNAKKDNENGKKEIESNEAAKPDTVAIDTVNIPKDPAERGLRTFEGDIADYMSKNNVSAATIAIAEEQKKRLAHKPAVAETAESKEAPRFRLNNFFHSKKISKSATEQKKQVANDTTKISESATEKPAASEPNLVRTPSSISMSELQQIFKDENTASEVDIGPAIERNPGPESQPISTAPKPSEPIATHDAVPANTTPAEPAPQKTPFLKKIFGSFEKKDKIMTEPPITVSAEETAMLQAGVSQEVRPTTVKLASQPLPILTPEQKPEPVTKPAITPTLPQTHEPTPQSFIKSTPVFQKPETQDSGPTIKPLGMSEYVSPETPTQKPQTSLRPAPSIELGPKPLPKSYSAARFPSILKPELTTKELGTTSTEPWSQPEPETQTQDGKSGKKIFFLLLSTLFVLGGVAIAYYLYIKSPLGQKLPVIQTAQFPKAVVPAETNAEVNITGLSGTQILARIEEELNKPQDSNTVREIILSQTGEIASTKARIQDVLTVMGIELPNILRRSLDSSWMIGVYANERGEKDIFVIVTHNFFQNAFAGMIAWERTIVDDLKDFIFANNPDFTTRGQFVDGIVSNRDVRAYVTQDGNIPFLYSFIDYEKIVYTSKEATLKEVIGRLERQSYIR